MRLFVTLGLFSLLGLAKTQREPGYSYGVPENPLTITRPPPTEAPTTRSPPPEVNRDSLANAQEAHGHHHDSDDPLQWLRDSVPGEPDVDYPILATVPQTAFSCADRDAGMYADMETRCQAWHTCFADNKWSFLCPNGTIFNQEIFTCVWWFDFECSTAEEFFGLNKNLYDSASQAQEVRGNDQPRPAAPRPRPASPPRASRPSRPSAPAPASPVRTPPRIAPDLIPSATARPARPQPSAPRRPAAPSRAPVVAPSRPQPSRPKPAPFVPAPVPDKPILSVQTNQRPAARPSTPAPRPSAPAPRPAAPAPRPSAPAPRPAAPAPRPAAPAPRPIAAAPRPAAPRPAAPRPAAPRPAAPRPAAPAPKPAAPVPQSASPSRFAPPRQQDTDENGYVYETPENPLVIERTTRPPPPTTVRTTLPPVTTTEEIEAPLPIYGAPRQPFSLSDFDLSNDQNLPTVDFQPAQRSGRRRQGRKLRRRKGNRKLLQKRRGRIPLQIGFSDEQLANLA